MRNELLKIMIYCDILAAKSNLIKVEKDLLCSNCLLHLEYKRSLIIPGTGIGLGGIGD